ncbi:MAG: hypothetical protein MI747_16720, partial [Desulfobacterales bacterium]|nr:hypothetical protein [Desulfobacterales bacterium]
RVDRRSCQSRSEDQVVAESSYPHHRRVGRKTFQSNGKRPIQSEGYFGNHYKWAMYETVIALNLIAISYLKAGINNCRIHNSPYLDKMNYWASGSLWNPPTCPRKIFGYFFNIRDFDMYQGGP